MKTRPFAVLSVPLILAACGDGPTAPVDDRDLPPPTIATVTVTSPIGPMLAPGASGQLTAQAVDTRGGAVAATFTWSSSDETIATVSTAGVVTMVGTGEVTLQAETSGVTGSVVLTSVEADLDAIAALLDDPLAVSLLTVAGDASLGESWARCAEADNASGPVRSLLTLYAQSMARILNTTSES